MSTSHQNRSSGIFSMPSMPAAMGSGRNLSQYIPPQEQLQNTVVEKSPIVLQGYLTKLKTMRKKYFVLYRDTNDGGSARLEYYDSEKKFKSRSQPNRKILLKSVQINRRLDTKHTYLIAFQSKSDCFNIKLETEADFNKWLRACLALQKGEEIEEDPPKSTFEHVWQVHLQRKGLAEEKGIIGNYHLCLTEKSLSLVRIGLATTLTGENRMANVEFLLMTIRRCGNTQIYFYLEVGRHSAIGSGELWMETEDSLIAENMHTVILNAMIECNKIRDDPLLGPVSRNRSSSATESSKPIPMLQRRQTHTGNKPLNMSFSPSGGTLGRERCDSLPSRNRTTSDSSNQSVQSSVMPPPRLIHTNRPHSIPSGACSESDGSSLSIDETDGFTHEDSVIRYISSMASGTMIPEENVEEYWYNDNNKTKSNYAIMSDKSTNNASLSLPISQSQSFTQRKGSPAPRLGSIEGSNSYIEMYSPCGSSPGDPAGGAYIPMSPVVDFSRGIYTGSSGAHSRASSLAEETIDGYVHMCPTQTEEYVDMDPTHRHRPTNSMSSAASSCSITSGTPSTDMRFAEYHLDKVSTRFTPDNEDNSSIAERPIRAYSVGSKLEHNKRKLRVDMLNAEHARVRAFSVGSRAKVPRSDLYRGVLTPSQTAILNAQENTNPNSTINVRSKKSSSAPILTVKNPNSVDPMDDLMEIDYSKKDDSCSTPTEPQEISTSLPKSKTNNLMEINFSNRMYSSTPMKTSLPVPVPNSKRYDNKINVSPKSINRYSEYVEMRPQIHTSDPVTIALKRNDDDGYLNMRPVSVTAISKSPSLSSSPVKSVSAPKTVPFTSSSFSSSYSRNSNYIDTSSRSLDKMSSSPKTISNDYLNMRPDVYSNSKAIDLPKTVSAPEGYMEMSWGRENKTISNNAVNEKQTSDEYINMNYNRQDPRLTSSLPITIQNHRHHETKSSTFLPLNQNISNMNGSSPDKNAMRVRCDSKDSGIVTPSGSQAAIFPFSPSSPMKHFGGQNLDLDINTLARKCLVDGSTGTIRLSEEDERSYDVGPTVVVDPTKVLNTSFPIKLIKLSKENNEDKSLVGNTKSSLNQDQDDHDYVNCAPVGTKPKNLSSTTDYTKIDDGSKDYAFMDLSNKLQSIKHNSLFGTSTEAEERSYDLYTGVLLPKQSLEELSSNYADMSLGGTSKSSLREQEIEISPYVNYAPAPDSGTKSKLLNTTTVSPKIDDGSGDYAFMVPSKTQQAVKQLTGMKARLDEISEGFKPIVSNADELVMRNTNFSNKSFSPKPIVNSVLNRQLSEKRGIQDLNESGAYEILQIRNDNAVQNKRIILSRPNSVNSEKISSKNSTSSCFLNRPNSANSDRLPVISSSSSSSTLCGSSSSSTLFGSKCQSPSTSMRPQSLGDIGAPLDTDSKIESRPPSVSSERELHYASLDLPPTTSNRITDVNDISKQTVGDSASPSPNTGGPQQAFTYAQIDFVKSENLKAAKHLTKSN